jgi:cytochrome c oxidase subunit IV
MVDYLDFQGLLRWSLILVFMFLKAGLIVAVFMHMMWERMALICAILVPPGVIIILIALMALEADYTYFIRLLYLNRPGVTPE